MGKLLELLNDNISTDEQTALCDRLQEDVNKLQSAFRGFYPMLLSGILQAEPAVQQDAQEWFNRIADDGPDQEPVSAAFLRGESSLTQRNGQELLQLIFPSQTNELINILANYSGLKPGTATVVLDLGCAVLTSVLRQADIKQQIQEGGLRTWLIRHQPEIDQALPPSYVSMTDREELIPGTDTERNRMMPLLLLCLLGIGIWYWVKGCRMESGRVANPPAMHDSNSQQQAPNNP